MRPSHTTPKHVYNLPYLQNMAAHSLMKYAISANKGSSFNFCKKYFLFSEELCWPYDESNGCICSLNVGNFINQTNTYFFKTEKKCSFFNPFHVLTKLKMSKKLRISQYKNWNVYFFSFLVNHESLQDLKEIIF